VLLAAFAVRVIGLGAQSLWWDEAYSALLAAQGPRAILRELRDFDFHPPAHYLMDYLWMPVAGQSEFALRFPSLVAGTLTAAIGAKLGARLFGRAGGLIAGLTFAFSPFLVYYSQEARMYAAAGLFTVGALYAAHRALERDEWRWWLAFAGACVAGLYTFYYTAFIPITVGAYAVATAERIRPRLVRLAVAAGVVALAYAPWVPVLLRRNAVWDSQWATTSSPIKVVAWTWQTLVLGIADPRLQTLVAGTDSPKLGADALPMVLLAALAIALVVSLTLSLIQRRRDLLFAAIAFAVPVALIAAIVYTPWGQKLFGTAALAPDVWLFTLPFAAAMLVLEEARKAVVRGRRSRR